MDTEIDKKIVIEPLGLKYFFIIIDNQNLEIVNLIVYF